MAVWDVTGLSSALDHDGYAAGYRAIVQLDATHVLLIYRGGSTGTVRMRVFVYNSGTGAMSAAGAEHEAAASYCYDVAGVLVDSTHVLALYRTAGGSYARVFTVNLSTWAISASASALSTSFAGEISVSHLSDNHYAVAYIDSTNARVGCYDVNLATWAVTRAGGVSSELSLTASASVAVAAIDSTHVLVAWGATGYAQVCTLNTETWLFSTVGTAAQFGTAASYCKLVLLSGRHAVVVYAGPGDDGFARYVGWNESLQAFAGGAGALEFDTSNGTYLAAARLDSTHFAVFWSGYQADGYVRAFACDVSTSAITAVGTAALEHDTSNGTYNACTYLGDGVLVAAWAGTASSHGMIRAFDVDVVTAINAGVASVVQVDYRRFRVTFAPADGGAAIPDQTSAEDVSNWSVQVDDGPVGAPQLVERVSDTEYDATLATHPAGGSTVTFGTQDIDTDQGGNCDDPAYGSTEAGAYDLGIASIVQVAADQVDVTFEPELGDTGNPRPVQASAEDPDNWALVCTAEPLLAIVAVERQEDLRYRLTFNCELFPGTRYTLDASGVDSEQVEA